MFRKTIWSAGAVSSIWKKVPLSTENGIDCYRSGRDYDIVGQEIVGFFVFWVVILDATEWLGVIGFRSVSGQRYGLVSFDSGWLVYSMGITTTKLRVRFGADHEEGACVVHLEETGEIQVTTIPWHRMTLLQEPEYPGHLRRVISRWRCGWKLEYSHASPAECAIWRRIWLNGTSAQGKTDRHRSIVDESSAYTVLSRSRAKSSPAYKGRATWIRDWAKSA